MFATVSGAKSTLRFPVPVLFIVWETRVQFFSLARGLHRQFPGRRGDVFRPKGNTTDLGRDPLDVGILVIDLPAYVY